MGDRTAFDPYDTARPFHVRPFNDPAREVRPGWIDDGDYLDGPDGFECRLGEPEDRIWGRDAADVVWLLNEQHARIRHLEERQAAHLAQIASLSQSVPLESEVKQALDQRGALLAEVGTLKARVAELEASLKQAEEDRDGWHRDAIEDTERLHVAIEQRDEVRAEVAKLKDLILDCERLPPPHAGLMSDSDLLLVEECMRNDDVPPPGTVRRLFDDVQWLRKAQKALAKASGYWHDAAVKIDAENQENKAEVAALTSQLAKRLAEVGTLRSVVAERDAEVAKLREQVATLNMEREEREELRRCLRIAMLWCPDEGGFDAARKYERCRRALGEEAPAIERPSVETVTRRLFADYVCNRNAVEWINTIRTELGLVALSRDDFKAERRAMGEQVDDVG